MRKQLSLFPVSENKSSSLTPSVSDKQIQAINRFCAHGKSDPVASVNTYSPGRQRQRYYRISYREGRKIKHLHIPGGSTSSALAQHRAQKLTGLIERGAELSEILAMVKDFKS